MKWDEPRSPKRLIRNGKYFVAPPSDDIDFKALFQRLVTAGAGRPVDTDGFPQGPWTPDLLADAISQIDANRTGVDLRTVQLWFQENDRGVSADNIRWLARIFGCDDLKATSEWQAELSAAQRRLVSRRGRRKRKVGMEGRGSGDPTAKADATCPPPCATQPSRPETARGRIRLAARTEALFAGGSPLNLPAAIFAGAVALQLGSYFLGLQSAVHVREDGVVKQVGFLWAPNWTLLFTLLLPLFLAIVVDVLVFWRRDGRNRALTGASRSEVSGDWIHRVDAATPTYWAVLFVCVVLAGVVQWIEVALLPLLGDGSDYALDWATLAADQPDIVPVPLNAAFTAVAYFYMAFCFYLLLAGLILLWSLQQDLQMIRWEGIRPHASGSRAPWEDVDVKVIAAHFRCTMVGLLIAICMKLQTVYLATSAPDILSWIIDDVRAMPTGTTLYADRADHTAPTHYTSLVIALIVVTVFLHCIFGLDRSRWTRVIRKRMATAVVAVALSYLLIGGFTGFSILLGLGLLVALYGIVDPGFGTRRPIVAKDSRVVP